MSKFTSSEEVTPLLSLKSAIQKAADPLTITALFRRSFFRFERC